jgi:phosphotransferase system enzyme I (PtsP)
VRVLVIPGPVIFCREFSSIREALMKKKDRDHLNLLCDIGELATILTGSDNIESFLQRTVKMVARHLDADVCSIYLYDENLNDLILTATLGLNPAAVGKVRMKLGEGLVGTTMEQLQPILEGSGSRNPKFKYFEEADEDRYESFLAVPIQKGVEKIGVLVVQHEQFNYFNDIDVMALRALASQLAGAIENARLLMSLDRQLGKKSEKDIFESLRFIRGKRGAAGYAFAPSTVFRRNYSRLMVGDPASDPHRTLKDFYRALKMTGRQLVELQTRVSGRLPESAALIFTAHFMILKDESFITKIVTRIGEGVSPAEAVRSVARYYISVFASSSHAYMREKVVDIEDLANRILVNLQYKKYKDHPLMRGHIVIAPDLYPSDMLKLASEDVKGIILVSGGVTSHVSILSRSMEIPLIIADRTEFLNLPEGTPILMDAEIGNIYVKPSKKVVQQFETRNETKRSVASMTKTMSRTTKTKDGVRVRLLANINLLSELGLARDLKAEGVGLYRTEFPFLIRSSFPSEEEQYHIYKRLFEEMAGKIVTIRTLDVAGDKLLPYSDATGEANPSLGLRSIRFSLSNRDIFEQQLQAILRAASNAKSLRIMFPLITSVDEFREAKQVVFDCMKRLSRLNLPHHDNPAIGLMIELPSLVEIIDQLALEADFFSIGTNDFVQYTLAVDRTNEKVSEYYKPYHPSVLRGLSKIVKAIVNHRKDLSVCGEMAHEEQYIPFLLGVGIRTFSVNPQFLPAVQKCIAGLSLAKAESFAGALLSETTIRGVLNVLNSERESRTGIHE